MANHVEGRLLGLQARESDEEARVQSWHGLGLSPQPWRDP
jgi:hypothetical protein